MTVDDGNQPTDENGTKDPPTKEDEPAPGKAPEKTDDSNWKQNYQELRSKFNQRDKELKSLREKVKEVEAMPDKSGPLEKQLKELQSSLKEYEKWYQEHEPVFREAIKDPRVAAKVMEVQKNLTRPLTAEQVKAIVLREQQDAKKEDAQAKAISDFVSSNKSAFDDPLVQDRFEKEIKRYPDGYEFDKDVYEIALERAKRAIGFKDEPAEDPKEKATAKEEERKKKVANAQVGQGSNTPPATPKPQQAPSLFAAPPGRTPSKGLFG